MLLTAQRHRIAPTCLTSTSLKQHNQILILSPYTIKSTINTEQSLASAKAQFFAQYLGLKTTKDCPSLTLLGLTRSLDLFTCLQEPWLLLRANLLTSSMKQRFFLLGSWQSSSMNYKDNANKISRMRELSWSWGLRQEALDKAVHCSGCIQ